MKDYEKMRDTVMHFIEKEDNKGLKKYFSTLELPDKAYLVDHLSEDEKLLIFSFSCVIRHDY